ncbi:MAG: DUF4350 domain-containing protein, partial [Candidatus Odinarchaeota archaeon]
DVDFWVYLYKETTIVDSYEVNIDSWSHTLSYNVSSGSLGAYSFQFVLNLVDGDSDDYVSDLDIRFRSEIHWPFDPPLFGGGDPWKGVAPDANLVGVKVLDQHGSGWVSDIVDGINWVITNRMDYNITTMSLSLGGASGDTAVINAVNSAVENGIVTVVSAGNSGPGGNFIGSPGDADNVITVAAMSVDDEITDYSSQGGPSYTGNTIKPDITAPGGSFYNLQMFSTDTNDNDGEGAYGTDVFTNDLWGAQGTSMSAPAVAGASNLLIEAMGGHEDWGYTPTEAKRVKSLLLMSATETYPLLRETYSSISSPLLNRGGKDIHEGYGRLNVDVAIEAYTQELTIGSQFNAWVTSSLIEPFNKHGLGCYVNLINEQNYIFTLDVPSGADFDLFLYSDTPSSIGEPILVASSTSTELGMDETIFYTAANTGKYYLIAKVISGEGNAIISYPIIEHDLSVSLEVPSDPDIGDTYVITGTVINTGSNDEINVDLFLYLNNVLINSTNVPNLPVGATVEINYIWIPTDYGTYNFTVYAPPIIGESYIMNNLITKLLTISSLRNYTMISDYTYAWIDASGGIELLLSDDGYSALSLPFDFQFYNATFSTIYLGANGYLSFAYSTPSDYSNDPIPSADSDNYYLIAPFWDDIDPTIGGHIYVQSFGSYWVAEWLDVYHYTGSLIGSFEIILYESGDIIFNYDYLDYTADGYTCGLNLGVDTKYYNTYQNLNSLTENLAILFTQGEIELNHDLGVSLEAPSYLSPGETILINATIFNFGIYNETDVKLQLLINDTLVSSQNYSILLAGESKMLSYSWTPIVEGIYNIVSYAVPVINETFLSNNYKMATVRVVSGRVIFFDEAHLPLYSIGSNPAYSTVGGYSEFAEMLIAAGHIVQTIDPGNVIDASMLIGTDILVITASHNAYTVAELDAIKIWVENGGRLLLITDWGSFGTYMDPLAARFGFNFANSVLHDSDEGVGTGITSQVFYDGPNILPHPITIGVSRVEMYAGDGLIGVPIDEIPIIKTDTDGTATWDSGATAFNVSVLSLLDGGSISAGRVCVIGDCSLWSSSDTDDDGELNFYDSDNEILAWNIINWLSLLPSDSIIVTNPNSVSSWETGTSHFVTWISTANISDIKIELYENDLFVMEIVASTPNDGSYNWAIPSSLTDSTLYQIKITDVANPATNDFSNYFEIFTFVVIDSLIVTNPVSTSSWETGSSRLITWVSTGSISDIKIELYKNNLFVMEIIASTPNDGSYNWAIATDLEDSIDYQIRISDVSNPATFDDSDYFAIRSSPRQPESPDIPGYNLYLIIAIICFLSIILTKGRTKKA